MDTRTRIRLFAGSIVAVLALVTGWGLGTDAGRHPTSATSAPVSGQSVSEETIKSHVASILRKLAVPDRTRAAVLAVRAGLVDN